MKLSFIKIEIVFLFSLLLFSKTHTGLLDLEDFTLSPFLAMHPSGTNPPECKRNLVVLVEVMKTVTEAKNAPDPAKMMFVIKKLLCLEEKENSFFQDKNNHRLEKNFPSLPPQRGLQNFMLHLFFKAHKSRTKPRAVLK